MLSIEAFIFLVNGKLVEKNIKLPINHPMWVAVALAWRNGKHPDEAANLVLKFYGILKEGTH